eukprot:1442355-Lingulodinium_polyedra.AAC.1
MSVARAEIAPLIVGAGSTPSFGKSSNTVFLMTSSPPAPPSFSKSASSTRADRSRLWRNSAFSRN